MTSAFLTGSPASKLGVVEDGLCVRIVVVSVAACLIKSTKLTFGNETVVGKKVTVSQLRTLFLLGNPHYTHL